MKAFKVPKRANLLYAIGGVLLFGVLLQILTGVSMAIHYVPALSKAFVSVNMFMRKFKYGWLVRSAHANGASLMFCALYAHMFKAMYYRSYVGRRRRVWLVGSAIYALIMCISFMGCVLPWSQLSYWAAVVATSFINATPLVGKWLRLFVLGGHSVRDLLLKRFFVFHCFLPFALLFFVVLHVALVHASGQNDVVSNRVFAVSSRVNMFPVFVLKDLVFVGLYLLILCALCLAFPSVFSNKLNYEPADFYNTPADIKPEWYFMHYYSVLRVFESKLAGVFVTSLTLLFVVALPYIHEDLSSDTLKDLYKPGVVVLFLSFALLGILGAMRPSYWLAALARACVCVYLSFFLWPVIARLTRVIALSLVTWRCWLNKV
ncbi:MAG: putative cytochrome b [Candidatus Hodgkinia cicadicola]|nr:MAG: putative cytochrome b [Candidatus Hodgkinia cicadicola]